ncbi:metallophosphoesterase [Hyphococcus sp.]|uniref:metallophosphoesterase n=1 Tax=Hyphococcus sp. TaxID=2038636 RepID=UPI003CCB8CAA
MTGLGPLEWIKLAIFYASFLYFIAAPMTVWAMLRRQGPARLLLAGFFVIISLLAYGRFVEPRLLVVSEHALTLKKCFKTGGAMRIAVFSDTHNGLFKNVTPAARIVRRVNAAKPDFVLIAGDFTYYLAPENFTDNFSAFDDVSAPLFAVLGNHDIGLPGPDLSEALNEALPRLGVRLIDNQKLKLSNSRFAIELVGLSDHRGGRQDFSLLAAQSDSPRLVLTHNPATVNDLSTDETADLLIGGHTHGGQIQAPVLTCLLTGVCGDAAYGLRESNGVLTFTTSGTGMVVVPMRFRMPPRIDILDVQYSACTAK